MASDADRAGEGAARWLDGKQGAMEERIAGLVNVNSFTDNVEGGRTVGAMLRDLFTIAGLESRVKSSTRYADHLLFESRRGASAGPIALVGHLDTVFPPGTFEGFRRDGDLARGPGVLDMKGGLVVVAFALQALAETAGLDAVAPLRIAIVADEEVGSPEGQAIIREGIAGSDAALVFEAGRTNPPDAIITRRKGTGGMTARAFGKAAHAGNNHKEGVNALWAIARFVDRIQQLTDYDRGVTVNVGKIVGGQGKNTVPDEAEAALDIRFCTRADADALVAAIHRAAAEAAASVPGSRIDDRRGRLTLAPRADRGERRSHARLRGRARARRGSAATRRRSSAGGATRARRRRWGSRRSTGSGHAAWGFTRRRSGSRWPRSSRRRRRSRGSWRRVRRDARSADRATQAKEKRALRVFRLMKLHALAACAAMAAACAHEEVTPAIAVQPGAAARAMALLGHGGPNDPHAAPAADAGEQETAETEPGSIAFSCVEARGAVRALVRVPCRVTIAELGAAPAAGEGPTELVFETGKVVVEAPPGKYRVTVSRGPEYALATWDIDVVSGTVAWGPNEGAIVLRRVVDTRGYLAVGLRRGHRGHGAR